MAAFCTPFFPPFVALQLPVVCLRRGVKRHFLDVIYLYLFITDFSFFYVVYVALKKQQQHLYVNLPQPSKLTALGKQARAQLN